MVRANLNETIVNVGSIDRNSKWDSDAPSRVPQAPNVVFEKNSMSEQDIAGTDISVASLRYTEIYNIKIWFHINPGDFIIRPNNSLSVSKRVIIKRKETSTRSRWGNLFTNCH